MKRLWLSLVLGLAACAAAGPGPIYENVRPDGEPLRGAFNQARGKIRAIFLASPT
jgi:hypothetical protein